MSFSHAKNESEIVKIINKGNNINTRNGLGQTELHKIAGKRPDLIQPMLTNGANPDLLDKLGRTPVFYAKDKDCVSCIVEQGSASLLFKDKSGMYPFEVNMHVRDYILETVNDSSKTFNFFHTGRETPMTKDLGEAFTRFQKIKNK